MTTLNPIKWVEDKQKIIAFIRLQRSLHHIPAKKCITAWFVINKDIIYDDYELYLFRQQVNYMTNTSLIIIYPTNKNEHKLVYETNSRSYYT